MEVFCCSHIEIKGAGYRKINHRGVLKCRCYNAGMRPEHGFESLAPAFGLPKKVTELVLILCTVLPPRYLKLNLTAQPDRMDGFIRYSVADAKLEQERRRHREAVGFRRLHLEAQLRHSLPLSPPWPAVSIRRRNGRSPARPRFRRKGLSSWRESGLPACNTRRSGAHSTPEQQIPEHVQPG